MKVWWRPKVTPTSIDNVGTYEYGASVVNGRLFCCCGLNTDTIVSVRLDGSSHSRPWTMPGKLTADPAAVAVGGTRYMVFFTVGELDGTNNGIYRVRALGGKIQTAPIVVIPQATSGLYGTGQPSVAMVGVGLSMLAARFDRPGGGDQIRLFHMVDFDVKDEIEFAEVEDGASPEIFWHNNKLHIVMAGGGYIGVRTYVWAGHNRLRRERELEQAFPLSTGGAFHARTAVTHDDTIDGVGVERRSDNSVIIVGGNLRVWRAAGKAALPGTWGLRRVLVPMPL